MTDEEWGRQELEKLLARFCPKREPEYRRRAEALLASGSDDIEFRICNGILEYRTWEYIRYRPPVLSGWKNLVPGELPFRCPEKEGYEITGKLFPSGAFHGFTDEKYLGNAPVGKGRQTVSGRYLDRWHTKWGGGESLDGEIWFGDFSLDDKRTIYIVGDVLTICDIRYAGKADFWEYSSRGKADKELRRFAHNLEKDRIGKILNWNGADCEFWKMFQRKAKELYERSEYKGG